MHFDHHNSFQLFKREKSPKDSEDPFIAVKDEDSYLIGGKIFLQGSDSEDEDLEQDEDGEYYSKYHKEQNGISYKVFEDNCELYSHKDSPDIQCAMYVEALDSYFLVMSEGLYRKDLNDRPHYLYYELAQEYLPFDARCHPKLPGRIILMNSFEIRVINLFNKEIELIFKTERETEAVSFWGMNGDSLAVLQEKNHLGIVSLLRRKQTHLQQIESAEDDFRTAKCLWASTDKKFICACHYHNYDYPNEEYFSLQVFEVSDTSFKLRASCRGGHRCFGAYPYKIRFLKRFQENYLFLVFHEVLEGVDDPFKFVGVELFVFNSIKNTVKMVRDANLELESPPFAVEVLDVEMKGCRFIVVDSKLHVYKINVFSEE